MKRLIPADSLQGLTRNKGSKRFLPTTAGMTVEGRLHGWQRRKTTFNEWNSRMAMRCEMRIDECLAYSRLPLEGFVDFVAEVFDADVVAVDFFDEALAADAELFGRAHLVELAGD